MKNLLNNLYKTLFLLVPLFISTLFIIYLSYKLGNAFLIVHDSPLFTTFIEAEKHFFYFWNENNFGTINYLTFTLGFFPQIVSFVLHMLHIPIKMINLSFYFVSLNLIFYSGWWSFNKILKLLEYKKTLLASLLSAFFYTYNLFMIAAWHGGTADGLIVLFSAGPFIVYILISMFMHKEKPIYWFALAVLISITINTLPFAIALYLAFFLPLPFVTSSFFNKRSMIFFLSLGFASFFLSTIFLLPLILAFIEGDPYPLRTGFQAYAFPTNGISGLFRFFFEWTINQFWGGRNFHSYYPYYTHFMVIFAAFIIWLISLGTFLVTKTKNIKRVLSYLLLVIVLSLFIAKADQPPFGFVNEYIYKNLPIFSIFRTPDTKFGLPIVLALSMLISLAFMQHKKRFLRIFLLIAVIAQTAIFFTGIPILEKKTDDSYQRIIHTPHEFKRISEILNNDTHEGGVLMFPGLSYGNFDFRNGYGLTGPDLLAKMIERPTIFADGFVHGKSEIKYKELTEDFDAKRIGQAGIRYVLIRNNVNKINSSKENMILKNNSDFKELYSSRLGTLYEIKSDFYVPILSSKEGNFTIKYSKINPVQYVINLNDMNDKDKLLFMNSYHKGWKIFPIKKAQGSNRFDLSNVRYIWEKPVLDESHHLYGNFANSWEIDSDTLSKNKDATFLLYFVPQSYVYLGIIISVVSLLLISGCIYILYAKNKI